MTDKRWNVWLRERVDSDPKIEAFLDDIEAVCRKHGLAIGHEDGQGAFQIENLEDLGVDWLRGAQDGRRIEVVTFRVNKSIHRVRAGQALTFERIVELSELEGTPAVSFSVTWRTMIFTAAQGVAGMVANATSGRLMPGAEKVPAEGTVFTVTAGGDP